MSRRTLALLVTAAIVATTTLVLVARSAGDAAAVGTAPAAGAPARSGTLIVGPGRVEPISEEIDVSGEVPGRLRTVLVDEGDRVARGQVLAEVEPAEYQARVAAARAALGIARAEEARLVNG